ncbi:MAG: hypothetical protein V4685_15260 [Bacteroidota bacterium]
MKKLLFFTVCFMTGFTAMAQLPELEKKEILVQAYPKDLKVEIDCKSVFMQPKADYKPFVDFLKTPEANVFRGINFLVKYTAVSGTSDAMYRGDDFQTSLSADFMAFSLDCSSIKAQNIPFMTLSYTQKYYDVSLAANMGVLALKEISTNALKLFTLTKIADGVFRGTSTKTVNNVVYKETVIVILTKSRFSFG